MKGGVLMNRKGSWLIKGIPVLVLAGIIALNLLVFPKILAVAGSADERRVVKIAQDEVTEGISQGQAGSVKEANESSDDGGILDPDMYARKIESREIKAVEKEEGVIWIMVDPDTAKEVNGMEKINSSNLGILVVEIEENK